MTYDILLFTDQIARYWHIKALGAYRIATELRNNGYSVKVIDYAGLWFANKPLLFKIFNKLVGTNTLFIGFSTTFFGVPEWLKKDSQEVRNKNTFAETYHHYPCSPDQFEIVLKYLKKQHPHVKIVLGGAKVDLSVKINQQVDFVVLGLADSTVVELADHIRKQTPIKYTYNLNNTTYKIINHDVTAKTFDFVNSRTLFEDEDHVFPGEVLPIETSRGCMFKCKFCDFPLLGRKKTDPEYHKHIDILASEFVRNWEKFKTKKYLIVDDTFNETAGKLLSIKDSLEKAKLEIKFSAHVRLDLLGRYPEQLTLLKDLGVESVYFGIESLNHSSLKSIGKAMSPEKIKDLLKMCNDKWKGEVSIHSNFIAGLPYETPDTLAKWMEWVASEDNPSDSYNIGALTIKHKAYDSSIFAEFPEKYGYILSEEYGWKNNIWDYVTAQKLADSYNNQGFLSGRIKIGGFDFSGFQNFGYEYQDLKGLSYIDLSVEELKSKYLRQFEDYKNALFKFEEIS